MPSMPWGERAEWSISRPALISSISSLAIKSNVVLRGERSFNTQIVITNVPAGEVHGINIMQNTQSGKWIDIESGYDLHSSILTLTNVSSFTAGCWVEIHEGTNAAWKMSNWPDMIGQIVQVTEVTSTTPPAGTVHLASPLRIQCEPSLPLNGVLIPPQIRRIVPIENAGVENLHISRTVAGTADTRDNTYSIGFRFAVHCWVRGCEFSNSFGAALGLDYSANCEFTGNYIHDAYEFDGGGSGYGVCFTYRTSEILTENNIFKRLRHSMLTQAGCNGNVYGYNYSRENNISANADLVCHGNYTYANLFEGNCGARIGMDASSGHGINGPFNVFLRNRTRGGSGYAIYISDSACSNVSLVGSEWVGGVYNTSKNAFLYGNNDDGTITPAGTTNLQDYSYYLGTNVTSVPPKPSWWNIPGFIPTYGPNSDGTVPPVGTERDIPARVRWNAGAPYTYGPPSIAAQPTNCGVNAGQAAAFTVTATGTPRAIFQWYRDGLAIPTGTNAVLSLAPAAMSDAGTYRALVTDSNGLMWSANATLVVNQVFVQLITSGSPQPKGTPLPYGYGTQSVSAATWITNSVDSAVYSGSDTRQVCTGWVGSGSIPVAGNSNTVTVQIVNASSLKWLWTTHFRLSTAVDGHGSVSGDGWFGTGTVATVSAIPEPPRVFVEWSGDVPEQDRQRNPLELIMDRPRTIRAQFAPAHETGAILKFYGNE